MVSGRDNAADPDMIYSVITMEEGTLLYVSSALLLTCISFLQNKIEMPIVHIYTKTVKQCCLTPSILLMRYFKIRLWKMMFPFEY